MEKHFFWSMEQIILKKKYKIFTIFVRPVQFPSKIQFSKKCLKLWRNTPFDEWNKWFCPKNFLAQFKIVQNFHYFCKVRACRISVKNSIFQKLPKIVEKHFFWWVEQIILPKNIFLTQFRIVQNFHYFCNGCACRISIINSIFQKMPKLWKNTFDEWSK